jgi:hypothetical protein
MSWRSAPRSGSQANAPGGNVCNNPCLNIVVNDAQPSPFELDLPASLNATAGGETKVDITIANRTEVAFSVDVLGPCIEGQLCLHHAKIGASPSNTTTARITVPAHSTVQFIADVWATNDRTASGTPLSRGNYLFSWSNGVIPLHVS